MARQPKDRPDVQVFTQIAIIDQLVSLRLERVLPEGLSHAQFGILTQLGRAHGDVTPAELARVFHVTKGAVTNTLQRLEAQGFVTVEPDPTDGRRKRIFVTPAGAAAHETALAAMRPLHDSLRSAFTEGEFVEVLPFLKALRTWLEETR
jgi:DNA-binding MarR family transcriptional regulator